MFIIQSCKVDFVECEIFLQFPFFLFFLISFVKTIKIILVSRGFFWEKNLYIRNFYKYLICCYLSLCCFYRILSLVDKLFYKGAQCLSTKMTHAADRPMVPNFNYLLHYISLIQTITTTRISTLLIHTKKKKEMVNFNRYLF